MGESYPVLRYFSYEHLPETNNMRGIASLFHELAYEVAELCPENPETSVALRKLLEAKDAAVRSAMTGPVGR